MANITTTASYSSEATGGPTKSASKANGNIKVEEAAGAVLQESDSSERFSFISIVYVLLAVYSYPFSRPYADVGRGRLAVDSPSAS